MSGHYVSVEKPCDEALADLAVSYNRLADKVEILWDALRRIQSYPNTWQADIAKSALRETGAA